MLIVDDILYGAVIGIASVGLTWCIEKWKLHRFKKKNREILVEVPMTEEDNRTIDRCKEILREEFPQGIESKIASMSLAEREELFRSMIGRLNEVYGVEISDIRFLPSTEAGDYTFGFYNYEQNFIAFNKDFLNSSDPSVVKEMINTIFHEMRHAYQYKAITNTGIGSEEQRRVWAMNMVNYIPAEVDFALYQLQAVENDARAYAELVLKDF